METTDSFGYWVRRRRKALDLTQDALAECVGCAVVTLRKIEADERRPSQQMAERLAQCLVLPAAECPWFIAAALGEQGVARQSLPRDPMVAAPQGNLPVPMTALIGRSAEVATITAHLRGRESRLLTLTGPVGVGKTRLALEVGRQLQADYRNGVYWVPLAPVRDPGLVAMATAMALGVREARDHDLARSVLDALGTRAVLLIFDNFEHLLPAAPWLSTLLVACSDLQILVTSRARLRLYGESEIAVAPLALPDPQDPAAAAESPSVRLFCERARAVRADFRLTPSLTPAVAEICRRMDGLPLAIELAAARSKLFAPNELKQRLERGLPHLDQDSVGPSVRLRGLEKAIVWSYELLSASQRTLLARLGVFVGGFTLPAAEAICASPFAEQRSAAEKLALLALRDVADSIEVLLDQSLLVRAVTSESAVQAAGGPCCPRCPTRLLRQTVEAEPRFSMLETIRDFALAQLHASGELSVFQQRHAEYFAAWVERAAAQLLGSEQGLWLAQLEREMDNVRAALDWLLATRQLDLAARMGCALGAFWQRHGYTSEGRECLEGVLEHMSTNPVSEGLRARTLQTAAMLRYRQGDKAAALAALEESRDLFHAAADVLGEAEVLYDLGRIALDGADWQVALGFNEESLRLAEKAADPWVEYRALTQIGQAQLFLGRHDRAAALFRDAYQLAQRLNHTQGLAVSLVNLGRIALVEGDVARATALAQDSVRLCHLLGERELMLEGLELLIAAAVDEGAMLRAAQLAGAAEAIRDGLRHSALPGVDAVVARDGVLQTLRSQLTRSEFEIARRRGRAMCLDAIAAFALGCNDNP
ncbi:MAG: AAA family ATPase [Anaerolineae bacterium]|nr:AAA family ATPase [Anaerolineae bacterium]